MSPVFDTMQPMASHKTERIEDMIEFCKKPTTREQQEAPYPKASPCSNNVATPASSGKKEHARTSNEHSIKAHRKQQQTTTKQWSRVRFLSPLPKALNSLLARVGGFFVL